MWNTYGRLDKNKLAFMHKHFTASKKNLQEGRYYTLVTSAFSQEKPLHFLFVSNQEEKSLHITIFIRI
jgi:hypothetical protein